MSDPLAVLAGFVPRSRHCRLRFHGEFSFLKGLSCHGTLTANTMLALVDTRALLPSANVRDVHFDLFAGRSHLVDAES
jgi:hypothetical protein